MARLFKLFTLQILFLSLLSFGSARPNLIPRDGLPFKDASTGSVAPLLIPDIFSIPQEIRVEVPKLASRGLQRIFARAFPIPPSEKTLPPVFAKLLIRDGFNAVRAEFLGGGKCGRIFKVLRNGTPYAVKITSPDPRCAMSHNSILLRENMIMALAKGNAHILQPYKLIEGETPERLRGNYGNDLNIMITEFCKHGALSIRGTPKPNRKGVIKQIQGIWGAVLELRSHGYYHKDIRPHHILVKEDGTWRLAGLGLVGPKEGEFRGNFSYAPPEMLATYKSLEEYESDGYKHVKVDLEKTDVFAFGVTMLEILYGKTTWQGDIPKTLKCIEDFCWEDNQMSKAEKKMFRHMLHYHKLPRATMDNVSEYIRKLK